MMDIKIYHFWNLGIRWCALLMIISIVFNSYGNGQNTNSIRIGRIIPEIVFENIINAPEKRFSTRELNGKPAILYFFSTGCKTSFAHFPEISQLYEAHKWNFTLIMVGIDLDDNVRRIFNEYSRKYNTALPATFDKSEFRKYSIRTVPNVIWIRSNGVVQAITGVLDKGYLEKFIAGKEFDFINQGANGGKAIGYNRDVPFLINGNGGESHDFIQRSLLSEWKIGMPNDVPFGEPNKSPLQGLKFLQAIGRGLSDLFRLAYFGRVYWNPEDSVYGKFHYSPIVEMKDKSLFQADYSLGINLFCYSQVLPPERRRPNQMMDVMQRDLKNFFGYDVTVETREMPYLSLMITDQEKIRSLITNGRPPKASSSLISIDYTNQPLARLVKILNVQLNLVSNDLPLIDETGINNNIDISFNAIMTDLFEVKASLQQFGLDLVEKTRPMKVIVIRESI